MKFQNQTTTTNSAKITFTPTGETAKDVRVSLGPLNVKQALATRAPKSKRKSK